MTNLNTDAPWSHRQSHLEGWAMCELDGRWALQMLDDPSHDETLGYTQPKFTSDAEAIIFVALKAKDGSAYHWAAINMISSPESAYQLAASA